MIGWILAFTPLAAISYEVIDIHPPSAYESVATKVNNEDEAAGWYKSTNSDLFEEVFFYDKEKKHHLLNASSTPPLLNDQGIVGGNFITHGWLAIRYPFLWNVSQGFQRIEIPKGWQEHETYLQDINAYGDLLFTNGADSQTSSEVVVASQKEFSSISGLNFGKALNSLQNIAGTAIEEEKHYPALFSRTYNKSQITAELEGVALAINDVDESVGTVLYKEKKMGFINTPLLYGMMIVSDFIPVDINAEPAVVGYHVDDEGNRSPALWKRGEFFFLHNLIDTEDELFQVTSINNNGAISGSIKDKDGKERAVLLKKGT